MKRQVVKTILFTSLFVLLSNTKGYAATSYSQSASSHREGYSSTGSSTCRSQQIYNQALTLKNTKVKFTQNDTEYIFDITADSSFKFWGNTATNKDLCKENYYDIPQPALYKTENFGDGMVIEENTKVPFADYYGDIYTNSFIKIKSVEIEYINNTLNLAPNRTDYIDRTKRSNGDKFFIPNSARVNALSNTYNYRNAIKYPSGLENNGEGVRIISNSSGKTYVLTLFDVDGNGKKEYIDTVNVSFTIKIAVDKSNIDDYRYLCFLCSEIGHTSTLQNTGTYLSNGYSLSTNTIDLKNFTTCNHTWSLTKSDATNHTIKCANCDWEKTEAHDYKFEYDGIANDVCICSRVKQVKYHYEINDNFNTSVNKTLNANSTCEKVEANKKTGYNFKWYEKYELQFDGSNLFNQSTNTINATKVFLNNTTTIDSTTGSRSIFYKAVYSPIKYVFNYSSKASTKDYISKALNKTISPQTFYYNSKDCLKNNSEYDYLEFVGWTLTEGSESVDFSSKAEILNYTSIDLSEFTIYPIYRPMEYKILYNTTSGKYDGDLQQTSKIYDYYVDEDFLKPNDMGKNKVFSHYVDMKGNEFTDMTALRNFIKDEAGDDQTIILFAMSKTIEGSTADDGISSTPQNYWDLNNKDDPKDDISNNGTAIDSKSNTGINSNNNANASNDDLNDGGTDKGSNNSTNKDTNNVSPNSNNRNNNPSANTNTNNSNNNNSTSNNSTSNNNNSTISYRYYPSNSGGGGGSSTGSERIKSFPEDKYTGPGVVNSLTDAISAEAKIGSSLNNSSPQYLYNSDIKLKNKDTKRTGKAVKKVTTSSDVDKKENEDEVFGPTYIDFETETDYHGPHGPWYYEKKYVDKILSEREEKLKEKEREEEFKLKENERKNKYKYIGIAVFSFLFIILIIIFEIFNIKQLKKKE